MGNVLLEGPKKGDPSEQYQRWLQQNPDLSQKQILSQNKLFRTSSSKFHGKSIIIKVFFKRDQSLLTEYLKMFEIFSQTCEKYKAMNISPLKLLPDKDNHSFVIAYRQKMAQTLEDLLAAKPSPLDEKKKWLIYQMIKSVYTVHKTFNFFHGHIRTSNFVCTTYGYLVLTDFAFYKPLYMLQDTEQGLPQLRVFYGSSISNCTLAPEKVTQQSEIKSKERSPVKVFYQLQSLKSQKNGYGHGQLNEGSIKSSAVTQTTSVNDLSVPPTILKLSSSKFDSQTSKNKSFDSTYSQGNPYLDQLYYLQKMDIFSLGCSILEVLRDGKPILNFQSYLQFKKGHISLDPIIEESCKNIQKGNEIKTLLKRMLSLSPDDRPNIQEIQASFNSTININIYSLIWTCTSAFSTTSFFLPDLRIGLIHSILKFISNEERGGGCDFKVRSPKLLEFFEALRIFKLIIRNKIIHVDMIPQQSILKKILESNDKENILDSEQEQILNEDGDIRKQFFVPLPLKRISSMKTSTFMLPKLERILTPPEWDKNLKILIEPKYRGTRLNQNQLLKNRFQDLIQEYKKNQTIREIRIKQTSVFYKDYNMVIKIIYSCIRSCKFNSSKLIGIQLIKQITKQSTDPVRLTIIIPLFISLLDDPDSLTAKYAFNSIIDVFYMFIDPFENQQQVPYYDLIIEMFINQVKTGRLRVCLFRRLSQIYFICQWLQIHIKKIDKRIEPKNSLRKLLQTIKSNYGGFSQTQIRQLMQNIPQIMWPQMLQFFISFLNSEKVIGLERSVSIAEISNESHKKILQAIDSCIESGLEENGFSLYFTIKYFTIRKMHNISLTRKIIPMIIHPHLWVREQARQYLRMCINENPPPRVFFLFRQSLPPPFPLEIKDMQDQILLPEPLLESQVDFNKRKLNKLDRELGIAEKCFLEYLQKMKTAKSYPIAKQDQVNRWIGKYKQMQDIKIEPFSFNSFIKKTIYQLFEANFLYYVGNSKSPYKASLKEEERRKAYDDLNEVLKKLNIITLDDNQVGYEKKDFFTSLSTILNSNFEKLLTRFMKQDKTNKIRISQSIYLIMQTLYRFEQFNIKQTFKLGQYNNKVVQQERSQKIKGSLITEIYQHKDVITCLANIADTYLVSGSYDGTVRIFNTKNIETNITCQSDGIHQINSDNSEEKVRINSLATFQNTYTVAAATNKGIIRVFQIQRMKGKGLQNRSSKNDAQLVKYVFGGEIQKILTFKNENRNECFSFVTAQGLLGIQDIRTRQKTITCPLGRERGLPKSMVFSNIGPSILVGTIDGYILTYDIRCNLISDVRQFMINRTPVSITGIHPSPFEQNGRHLFGLTYPSKNYQISYLDVYNDSSESSPSRYYTSIDREEIISLPTSTIKSTEQNFKLCNNTLTQKIYYKQLADFSKNFRILDYLSDPFTIKQNKIREVWMDRCKHRYNQISSLFNKKSIPFVNHLNSGILLHMNPTIGSSQQKKTNRNLSLLVEKIDPKDASEIEKIATCRPADSKIYTFQEQQNADYLTCSNYFNGMVYVGGWNSVIKVYR